MTIVDTSVPVAMIKEEPDADDWIARLRTRADLLLPASCYLEAAMVLRFITAGRAKLEISAYDVAILSCDARQAQLAADAFERYGRGSGHPARLNFGDCLAFAAAQAMRAPLLFKGEDFGHTDVKAAA